MHLVCMYVKKSLFYECYAIVYCLQMEKKTTKRKKRTAKCLKKRKNELQKCLKEKKVTAKMSAKEKKDCKNLKVYKCEKKILFSVEC